MLFHERARQIPKQWSWIDQRLVQAGHIDRLSHPAMGLYLFLVTVADAKGLSFYADATLKKRLGMSDDALQAARHQLLASHLIAYQKPFYQVLSLEPVSQPRQTDAPRSLGQLLKQLEERR